MAQSKAKSLPKAVVEIGKLSFEGNIIPHSWYQHIKLASGKPDLPAVIILAEIVYWYRPFERLDEASGQARYDKKFAGDMFQSAAAYYENKFGLTKDQARKALKRLEDLGLIRRELRDIVQRGVKMNNAMFIEPVAANIAKITYSELDKPGDAEAVEEVAEDAPANCAACPHNVAQPSQRPDCETPCEAPAAPVGLVFDFGLQDLTEKQREQVSAALAGVPDAQAVLDELSSAVQTGKVKARKPYISYLKTLVARATGQASEPFVPTSDLPERRRKAALLAKTKAASERKTREGAASKRQGPPGGSLKDMLKKGERAA